MTHPDDSREPICEYRLRLGPITEYGADMQAVLAGRAAPPPAGLRVDIPFAGTATGRLAGSLQGVDYLDIRADGRCEPDLRARLTTTDGVPVAQEAGGVAARTWPDRARGSWARGGLVPAAEGALATARGRQRRRPIRGGRGHLARCGVGTCLRRRRDMVESTGPTAAELFGGGAKPRDTRERILHAALDLFYEHGIHAIGLDRVLAEVGLTKTTFYNHFPSKDDLVLEVVKLRDEWELACFKKEVIERGEYDPKGMLLAMFDALDSWFNDPDYRGCLFISACAEFPSHRHPVHRAAAGHYLKAEADIAGMAKAAGVADPEAFARRWVVLLEGALTYRMVTGEDDAARLARPVAEALLERSLAGEPGPLDP